MKKENIIQFVGFECKQDFAAFNPQWLEYAAQIVPPLRTRLLQSISRPCHALHYISQHNIDEGGFCFDFMKDRNSDYFPEQQAKVMQIGGYIEEQPLQPKRYSGNRASILVFIQKENNDIYSYKEIPGLQDPGIYSAYYENSLYEYILEFNSDIKTAPNQVKQLRLIKGVEAAIYTERRFPNYKLSREPHYSKPARFL